MHQHFIVHFITDWTQRMCIVSMQMADVNIRLSHPLVILAQENTKHEFKVWSVVVPGMELFISASMF